MRFSFLIFFIIICFISCDKKNRSQIKNERIFNSAGLIYDEYLEVNLDSVLNYGHLLDEINYIACEKGVVLKFNFSKIDYKIRPFDLCPIWDYRLNQVLYLNSDSIFVNQELKYPLESLDIILEKHLNNKSGDSNYPEKDDMKFVQVFMDRSKTIDKTRNLLIKIISSYDKIKKSHDSISFAGIALRRINELKIIEQN